MLSREKIINISGGEDNDSESSSMGVLQDEDTVNRF